MKISVPSGLPSPQLPKSASVTAMAGARPAMAVPESAMSNARGETRSTYTIAPAVPGYDARTGVATPFASLRRMLFAAWSDADEPND